MTKTRADHEAAADKAAADTAADKAAGAGSYATTQDVTAILDELATVNDRLAKLEDAGKAASDASDVSDQDQARAAAAQARSRPRFLMEGERQDEIQQANARKHAMDPAGDAVPTGPATKPAGVSTQDTEAFNQPR